MFNYIEESPWLHHLIVDKAPDSARDSSEVSVDILVLKMTDLVGV